ncbi:MAG: hypothetical protein V4702_01575 [Patescibacteria group bacterium]
MDKNKAVMLYSFHGEILKPNVEQVVASFNYLQDTIASDLEQIKDRYKSIHFVGISLGNIALAMVADRFRDFSSATMVVPGSSLATSMWDGIRTQHLKDELEEHGWTKETLNEVWKPVAPVTYVDSFAGKDVRVIVSTADQMIPTVYQEELVTAMQQAGIDPIVERSRLGHLATIGRYCLTGKL